ncbi:MAG TPA: Na+/H+ antiporter NhaA [Actinomycetes bacterium]|nr:Na+/H+ antiporter NhaA [Actinomycetes bacterium]
MSEPARPGPELRVVAPRFTPAVRRFIANESGSAAVLLGATLLAVVWVNSGWSHSYEALWATPVHIGVGDRSLDMDLRHVVNDVAMSLFFLVLGVEIARETTSGELRNPGTFLVPALGALGGVLAPILIFLAINAGHPTAHGWGIVMSSDTAFVLGILALFGPRCPDQLRVFLLAAAVVDDVCAITVMALFYTASPDLAALAVSVVLVGAVLAMRWLGVWRVTPYVLVGLALWFAVYRSGVQPTLAGLLVGLLVPVRPARREVLRRIPVYGRAVVENPTAERARLATMAVSAAVPTGERLQRAVHPWSAYVVVPVFGLANAGVRMDADTLRSALHSPLTIGVVVGLVVGNTIGVAGVSWLALRTGAGALPGRVRYSHLLGGAVLAGIGFTIALFVTDLAFSSPALRDQAKIGILAGSVVAAAAGSAVLRLMGERWPLCSPAGEEVPAALPPLPWVQPVAL